MGSKKDEKDKAPTEEEIYKLWEELIHKIDYSEHYTDDRYEYRHVILPKPLLQLIPESYYNKETGTLRLLTEQEWRGIGIKQSMGWVHYEVHAPEPHVLLFRRPVNYQPPAPPAAQAQGARRQ